MKKVLFTPFIIKGYNAGGGIGVAEKIYKIDRKSFFNYIIHGQIKNGEITKINKKSFLLKSELLYTIIYLLSIVKLYFLLKKNSNKYSKVISNEIREAFLYNILNKKVLYVHHLNGTSYNEYKSKRKSNFIMKIIFNYFEKKVFKNSKIIGFPSKGAYEQYPNKELLKGKRIEIFYNGIDTQKIDNIKKNNLKNKIEFISVNTAIEGTGIDRIPFFLKQLKDQNVKFHWTFIGTGPTTKKIISEVKKYQLEENTTLILEKIEHKLVLEKMKYANFYLGFHRISIFDFAILEAMSQGCIPILTKVGGNKDFIEENNGLLINENKINDSGNEFIKYYHSINYKDISNKNILLVKNKFNTKNFFNKYKKIADEL